MRKLVIVIITGMGSLGAQWAGAAGGEVYPGYLDSVGEERYERVVEMVLPGDPDAGQTPLSAVIFEGSLTKEFSNRYERIFGHTDADRNVDAPNRFSEMEYSAGVRVTVEDDVGKKRKFGEYMVRRLSEHHLDGYIKNNPAARPLYDIKQSVSNVKVKMNKGYKFKIKYNYSANSVGFSVDNPYDLGNKVTLQMAEGAVGPGEVKETILSVYYPFENGVRIRSDYVVEDKKLVLITSRPLLEGLTGSLSSQSYLETQDPNQERDFDEEERDNRVLLGLSWNY